MQNFHPTGFTLHCRWQTPASEVDAVVLHTAPLPLFAGDTLPDQGISVPSGRDWSQDALLPRHP
jgi:hypothetical protein